MQVIRSCKFCIFVNFLITFCMCIYYLLYFFMNNEIILISFLTYSLGLKFDFLWLYLLIDLVIYYMMV